MLALVLALSGMLSKLWDSDGRLARLDMFPILPCRKEENEDLCENPKVRFAGGEGGSSQGAMSTFLVGGRLLSGIMVDCPLSSTTSTMRRDTSVVEDIAADLQVAESEIGP